MGLTIEAGAEPVPGYRLIERLGRGGYGEVWKASGPGGFRIALKFVPLAGEVGPIELRSLDVIREIRHPHLLGTFGSWQVDDTLIIAMELAERTLLDRFREAAGQGFPGIPAPEIFGHFRDAARGIDYLNEPRHPSDGRGPQGIQHRDIKPHNLLLVGGCVKVADFGLARVLENSLASHTGSMTPAYAAPEFFDRRTSAHSDQYSLAVTYCHLRGGRLPFSGSINEIVSGHLRLAPDLSMIPERERDAVGRALAKEPQQRWPRCTAFVEALEASLSLGSNAPTGAGPIPTGFAPETTVGPPRATTPGWDLPGVTTHPAPESASAPRAEGGDAPATAPAPKPEAPASPAVPVRRPGRRGVFRVPILLAKVSLGFIAATVIWLIVEAVYEKPGGDPDEARWPILGGSLLTLMGLAVASCLAATILVAIRHAMARAQTRPGMVPSPAPAGSHASR